MTPPWDAIEALFGSEPGSGSLFFFAFAASFAFFAFAWRYVISNLNGGGDGQGKSYLNERTNVHPHPDLHTHSLTPILASASYLALRDGHRVDVGDPRRGTVLLPGRGTDGGLKRLHGPVRVV